MTTPTIHSEQSDSGTIRPEANAAGGSAATLTLVYWLASRFLFHGQVPAEVSGFIYMGLPWIGAYVGAVVSRRRRVASGKVITSRQPTET